MKSHEIKQKECSFSFSPSTGKYSVILPEFELKDLTPYLKLDQEEIVFKDWKVTASTAKSLTACASAKAGKLELKAVTSADGAVKLTLKASLTKTYEYAELYYFRNLELKAEHVLQQHGQCGIPLAKGVNQKFDTDMILAVTRKNTQLTLSCPVRCTHVPMISGTAKAGKVTGLAAGSVIRHFPSKKLELSPLTFRSGDGFRLFDVYASENREEGKDKIKPEPAGWNSWDYYRWTVTEEEVLKNAEFIASDKVLSKYVKKFIIDDGWQYAYGEWDANKFFPHGMEWLAKQLKKLKFEPGLWMAPLICEPHSYMYQMDRELFAMSDSGYPMLAFECMGRRGLALDPTNPRVRKYLEDLIRRYTDMGYKHFKLDFLASITNCRRFYDPLVPRGDLVRLAIEAAKRGAAGRARILGCGYSFSAGGIVDSCRIGGDIHAAWDDIRRNEKALAAHYWMNKTLFQNDPDFALCRSFDTSDDPDINRLNPHWGAVRADDDGTIGRLAENSMQVDIRRPQSEILLSLVLVSGGTVNLSDNMPLLNEAGLELARRTVSAETGDTGIPLDLFYAENPRFWMQKVSSGYRILMINWSDDAEQEMVFDLKSFGIEGKQAFNFWTDEKIKIENGRITAVLNPRSCLFAVVK